MPATQAQVTHGSGQARPAAGYDHIRELLAGERCVLLDGGIATQLAGATDQALDEKLWGTGPPSRRTLLGGCCGAGPEHVRALAGRLATTETYATARLDH